MGRTSHNKTLNFTAAGDEFPRGKLRSGLVTGSFPNSLLGELVV